MESALPSAPWPWPGRHRRIPSPGLAPEEDVLKDAFPDLDLLDTSTITADALVERARTAEAAALGVSGVSKSGGARASWSISGLVLVTSNGFSGGYLASRHGVSATAIAGEGTAMERDYDHDGRAFLEDLEAAEEIGRRAGERAAARVNPRKLSSRRADVIYEPRTARTLLGHFAGAINGAGIARGTSFLKDRLGEAVFPPRSPSTTTRPSAGDRPAAPSMARAARPGRCAWWRRAG